MDIREILKKVDHTLLGVTAGWSDIEQILIDAEKFGTASACIPPAFVKRAKDYVGDRVKICTVIGFPNGYNTTAVKCFEAETAVKEGAEEMIRVVCLEDEVKAMENGIHTLVGTGGVRLSGGQAQRLALARTLYHKRPVLVLDDPFSALDKETEVQIFLNLKELAKDSIIILISHRLYLFDQMDQVIWMDECHTKVGTHEELLATVPSYAELCSNQTKGGSF